MVSRITPRVGGNNASALSRRKQGFESLGSANEIKKLIDQRQALSRHCPGGALSAFSALGLCQVALGHGERTGGHGCRAAAAGTGIFGARALPPPSTRISPSRKHVQCPR
jgi:hypothetical protein